MNQKIDTKLGVIIIVIVVATVGVFVWIYEKNKSVEMQKIEQTQLGEQKNKTQQEITIATTKEVGKNNSISISAWKSYANKKYGYSLKYPSTWITDDVDGSSFYIKELQKHGERFPNFGNVLSDNQENLKNITGDYFINISVYKNIGTHVNLKEWRKYEGCDYKGEVLIKENPTLKFEEKPHKSYSTPTKDMAGSLRYYFIDTNNDGYAITVWYKDNSNGIGERIISTLDFGN